MKRKEIEVERERRVLEEKVFFGAEDAEKEALCSALDVKLF